MLLGIILFLIGACEGLDLCAVYLFVLRLVKGRRFVKAETYHMMFARRGPIKGGQDKNATIYGAPCHHARHTTSLARIGHYMPLAWPLARGWRQSSYITS